MANNFYGLATLLMIYISTTDASVRQSRIHSHNLPSWNIGFNAAGRVSITTTRELFRVVSPGLMGVPSTVSFESVRYPGRYLRHRSYVLHLDTFKEGNHLLFKKDATFYPRPGRFFEGYTAFESYNIRNYFIRHENYVLKISPASDTPTELFRKDASFVEYEDHSSILRQAPVEYVSSNYPQYSIGFTKDNLPAIATTPFTEGFRVVSPGLNNQCGTVSLESDGYPGHYLRHKNFLIHLDPFEENQVFFDDATFWIREGVLQQSYVSFESYNFPNRYIRHQGLRLKLHAYDGSELFKMDASFLGRAGVAVTNREGPYNFISKNIPSMTISLDDSGIPHIITSGNDKFYVVRPGLTGQEGTVSLASAEFPGHYLRHRNLLLHLDPFEETSLYGPDATFYLRPNHFYSGYFVLESTNIRNHFVRHHYYRMKLHRYDGSELFRLDSSFKLQ